MKFLTIINDTLGWYGGSTSGNIGTVNEITPDQLRKKRNIQLIVGIVIISAIVATVYHLNKNK